MRDQSTQEHQWVVGIPVTYNNRQTFVYSQTPAELTDRLVSALAALSDRKSSVSLYELQELSQELVPYADVQADDSYLDIMDAYLLNLKRYTPDQPFLEPAIERVLVIREFEAANAAFDQSLADGRLSLPVNNSAAFYLRRMERQDIQFERVEQARKILQGNMLAVAN